MSEATIAQQAFGLRRLAQMSEVIPVVVDDTVGELGIDGSGNALELVVGEKIIGPVEAVRASWAWKLLQSAIS